MDEAEIRQAHAFRAIEGMKADGADIKMVINALCEGLGLMFASISPDAGGVVRNIEQYTPRIAQHAMHYHRARKALEEQEQNAPTS
jgi:hypothetical protein